MQAAMAQPAIGETADARFAAFSKPRSDEGRINEDAIAVVELASSHHLLLLADGVGGMPGGAHASAQAVDALIAAICDGWRVGLPMQHAVLSGFDSANQAILDSGGGATTLVVVEVEGEAMRAYHAGDSGVLVTGQRGRVKLMTMAHSPVGYAQEAGYLTEAEAMHHEERHVVSNLLGCTDMRIEVGQLLTLSPRDTVVVGSDGLFDNLLSDEVASIIRKGRLDKVARQLATRAASRMTGAEEPGLPSKPDDLSFILYRHRSRHAPAKTPRG